MGKPVLDLVSPLPVRPKADLEVASEATARLSADFSAPIAGSVKPPKTPKRSKPYNRSPHAAGFDLRHG